MVDSGPLTKELVLIPWERDSRRKVYLQFAFYSTSWQRFEQNCTISALHLEQKIILSCHYNAAVSGILR